MKKLISILLVVVLVAAALTVTVLASREPSGEAADEEAVAAPSGMLGGWSATESPEITPEVQDLMDKATEGLLGVDYTPVAYLGTQLVAGTNHCILCQAKVVYPDAQPYYALVYLYEDLSGNVEVLDIETLDLGEMMYRDAQASDDADGQAPLLGLGSE